MDEPDLEETIPVGPEKKRSWLTRVARMLLWLTVLLLILCTVFRLLLPTLVERGAAYGSRHYLGLPARIGNVDFSLRDGGVVLQDVSVGALPDGVTPWDAAWKPPLIEPAKALLRLDRIALSWSWHGLFHKKLRLTELSVDAPTVRVLREADGMIDPLRHAKPLAKPASQEPDSVVKSEPWPIEIQRFVLRSPDVAVVDSPSGHNLLEFSLESFELDDAAAVGADVGFGAVAIHGPELRVWRELVLAKPRSAKPTKDGKSTQVAATSSAPSATSGFRIRAIDMDRAKFTWVSKEGPLDVMLTLKASGITADQGKRFPLELDLQTGKGQVGLAGELGILPPFYEGEVTWDGLSFPPLLLAAYPELAAWLRSADASGELEVTADAAGVKGPPSLRFSGRASLDSFAAADPSNSEVSVSWQRLDVVMNEIFVPLPEGNKPLRATKADFKHISVVDPKIRYTHPSPSLESLGGGTSAMSPAVPATASPRAGQKSAMVDLAISRFELTGGDIELRDSVMGTSANVHDLAVALGDARYPGPTFGTLSMKANLPVASSLSIDGRLADGQSGDFVIALQGLDLPTFSPYAKKAGITLDAGKISLQTKLETRGPVIQADSEVVLNRLGISLVNPDSFAKEYGVPVDLALALLSDPAGDIKLTVPVRVDEKGLSVSAGTVIRSALKAALVGAISSPLKMIGAGAGDKTLSGAAPFSIAPIACLAGSAEPVKNSRSRIDSFVKLMASRPNMGLVLRGRVSAEDRPLIAAEMLLERALSGQDLPELSDVGFFERRRINQYLTKRGRGETVTLEEKDRGLCERYVAAMVIPESRLAALAKQRAEKVRKLLEIQGANPENLSIGEREADGEAGVVIGFR